MYQKYNDFKEYWKVDQEALDEILHSRILCLEGLGQALIIETIELLFNHGAYIVRTTVRGGLQGIAITNDRIQYVYPILQKLIAPYFIGKDARDLEQLLDEVYVYKSNYKMAGIPYFSCLAALELSILDLLAKARGVLLGELFGKRIANEVNIYVASGNRHTTPEEELECLRKRVNSTGAKAIKYKIGGRMSHNRDSMAGRSEGLIRLTREFFGDDMIIHADGNGSYDADTALQYGKILEDIHAYFYEEPCPFDDLVATREVTERSAIPIAFGEQETSLSRFRWLILNHGCDVVQPDILYNGGLIRTTKVARMADLAGMTITPHVSSGFCFVYILHLASFTPNMGKYQEDKEGLCMANDFLEDQIILTDGKMSIPTSVGIGIREDIKLIQDAIILDAVH